LKYRNFDEAVALLKKALALKDDLRFAYIDLGSIYAQHQKYDDAVAVLRKAMELDPLEPDAHYRLARIYQVTGRKAEAQKEFAKVVSLHQKDDQTLAPMMSNTPAPVPK
jgi:tetratricopeptide (TPR) repeat protein